jgi:hypothetical protein
MKYKRLITATFILLFLFYAFPSFAGDVRYYDTKNNTVGKAEYEKIINKRAVKLNRIIKEGYGDVAMTIEDPILLRKRRIEYWEKMRAKERLSN